MTSYVLDASAVLALINAETGHEKVAKFLPDSCISTVNLSEVVSILHTLGIPNQDIDSLLKPMIPNVIPFDESQAYQTAMLRTLTKNFGLSLGDRACLSLGQICNLPVVTADKAWSKLNLPIKIVLLR